MPTKVSHVSKLSSSFDSMSLFITSKLGFLWLSIGFFSYKITKSVQLVVHACMCKVSVWIWVKRNLIWFIEGWTHFEHILALKIEFDHQWTNIDWTSFKPPHYLQLWTKNYHTWKAFYAKNKLVTKNPIELMTNKQWASVHVHQCGRSCQTPHSKKMQSGKSTMSTRPSQNWMQLLVPLDPYICSITSNYNYVLMPIKI